MKKTSIDIKSEADEPLSSKSLSYSCVETETDDTSYFETCILEVIKFPN